jgi:cytochrome c6
MAVQSSRNCTRMVLRKKMIVICLMAGIVSIVACASSGSGESGQATDGFSVYKTNCMVCHGNDGKLGLSGAADLSASDMTTAEMLDIVANGKGGMMPYKELLSKDQREMVVQYIESLKE